MDRCERCGNEHAPYHLSEEMYGVAYSDLRLCHECLKRIVLGPDADEMTEAIIDEILERYRP